MMGLGERGMGGLGRRLPAGAARAGEVEGGGATPRLHPRRACWALLPAEVQTCARGQSIFSSSERDR